jgi:hypothetical protein
MFVCRDSAASSAMSRALSGAAISARYLRVNARHSPGEAADRACATSSALGAS